jgi:ubiquinone/menaquinone biosynthesis C-methylase UbiE
VTVGSDYSTDAHSAAFLNTPQRDFWWNRDFLELVARRLDLSPVRRVLDVGAGMGHWSTALLGVLPPDATLVGLDREPRWVERAQQDVNEPGVGERCRFMQGVAEQLPFEQESFDLVSCQTLLIHVPDPIAVIAEMRRVVRPGGLLLLSEPNNLAGMLVADTVIADKPVAD